MDRMKHRVEVYRDSAGEWRWRLRYGGDIIADSSEGYTRRRDCLRALRGLAARMLAASLSVAS